MLRSLLVVCLLNTPALPCAPPMPDMEVVANAKATIAPDGGVILAMDAISGPGDLAISLRSNGAKAEGTRIDIAYGLSILQPKSGMRAVDVPLPAPTLVRVKFTVTDRSARTRWRPQRRVRQAGFQARARVLDGRQEVRP